MLGIKIVQAFPLKSRPKQNLLSHMVLYIFLDIPDSEMPQEGELKYEDWEKTKKISRELENWFTNYYNLLVIMRPTG